MTKGAFHDLGRNMNPGLFECNYAYPFSPMLQFQPLQTTPFDGPQRAIPDPCTVYNIDGRPLQMNPANYRCSMSHLDQRVPIDAVYFQNGAPYSIIGRPMGDVITAVRQHVPVGDGGLCSSSQQAYVNYKNAPQKF